MVGKSDLSVKSLVVFCVRQEKRKNIQLDCAVPVENFLMAFVLYQCHGFERVFETVVVGIVIIAAGHVGMPYRRGRVCLYRAAEHIVVGKVTVHHTGCYIDVHRKQSTLCCMVHCRTRAVLLAVAALLDAVGVAVVGRHTIVGVGTAAAHRQGVLLLEAYLLHKVEQIEARTEVDGRISRRNTLVTIVIGSHHVEVAVGLVPGESCGICGVRTAVLRSFLGGDDDHTIRTARTVNSGCGTVFEHIERGNVVGVYICQARTGNAVEHNQRGKTGRTRRYTADLKACRRVRVG